MSEFWTAKVGLFSRCAVAARRSALFISLGLAFGATQAIAAESCVFVPKNTPIYLDATGSAELSAQDHDQDYYVMSRVGSRFDIRYSYYDTYVNISDVKIADCNTGRIIQGGVSPQMQFVFKILDRAWAALGSSVIRIASIAFGLLLFVLLLIHQATKTDVSARDTLRTIGVIAAAEVCFSGFIGEFPAVFVGFVNLLVAGVMVHAVFFPKPFNGNDWTYNSMEGQWYRSRIINKMNGQKTIFQAAAPTKTVTGWVAALWHKELIWTQIGFVSLTFAYFHGGSIFVSVSHFFEALATPSLSDTSAFSKTFGVIGGFLFLVASFLVMIFSYATVWLLWLISVSIIIENGFRLAGNLRERTNFPSNLRPDPITPPRTPLKSSPTNTPDFEERPL